MAGDWIPVRHELFTDPSVISIASALDLDETSVVGKLIKLWTWASAHTTDGIARGVTNAWIDRYVLSDGFASAMAASGWLRHREGAIEFPNFDRWMSSTAKTRLSKARQKRLERLATNVAKKSDIVATPSSLLSSSVSGSSPEGGPGETTPAVRPPLDLDPPVMGHWMDAARRLYAAYPRPMGERAALSAIAVALQVVEDRGEREPEAWLRRRVQSFAAAMKGKAMDYIPAPARWFADRRYDEDHAKVYGAEPVKTEMPKGVAW